MLWEERLANSYTHHGSVASCYNTDDQGAGVDGIIVSNTTLQRPNTLCSKWKMETGGLSGKPLKYIATSVISAMYILTEGNYIYGTVYC